MLARDRAQQLSLRQRRDERVVAVVVEDPVAGGQRVTPSRARKLVRANSAITAPATPR
jgi:hypothetical protein